MIKVSIITVNQNNAAGLRKTIKSVIEQSYPEVQFLVIDGGSTDGSVEIIKEYSQHMFLWVSEADAGVYHAMNKGVMASTGEYLLFLNSGDILNNADVLKELLVNETGDMDLIYGNIKRIYTGGKKSISKMPASLTLSHMLQSTLCHPATLIKKSLFNNHGLYDKSLKIVADWAFFLKVITSGSIQYKYKDITVASFHMDGMSSHPMNQKLILKERDEVLRQLFSPAVFDFIQEKLWLEKLRVRYRLDQLQMLYNKYDFCRTVFRKRVQMILTNFRNTSIKGIF